MKRLFYMALALIMMIGMLPCSAIAASEVVDTETIWYDDGSYMEITVEKSCARGASIVSGSKTYTFYGNDGGTEWKAKLSATFAYSGGWYTCTTANCDVTIYDNDWYVVSNSTIRSSNNAVTNLTMGRRVLGVTVEKPQYTIKITCDNNGNLS